MNTDHTKIKAPAQPAVYASAVAAPVAPAPTAQARPLPSAEPLKLALLTSNNQTSFAKGEAITLNLKPSRDAFVYCYLQDENAKITRFFPNRFAKDPLVQASRPLSLPGTMRFQLVMNSKGAKETIACYATQRDVLKDLPANVVGNDFEPLAIGSLDQIRAAFANTTGGALAQEFLNFQPM